MAIACVHHKPKKGKEGRKCSRSVYKMSQCKKTVLNKSVPVQVKDKKDKQKPGTVYSIPCMYGQLGPGLRNNTGILGSVVQVSHVQ
jgi:hypothetical protein